MPNGLIHDLFLQENTTSSLYRLFAFVSQRLVTCLFFLSSTGAPLPKQPNEIRPPLPCGRGEAFSPSLWRRRKSPGRKETVFLAYPRGRFPSAGCSSRSKPPGLAGQPARPSLPPDAPAP